MSGTQHEDQQTFIFDFTYQAEISDAIFPELSETLPLQGLPYAARVFQTRSASEEEFQNSLGMLSVESLYVSNC